MVTIAVGDALWKPDALRQPMGQGELERSAASCDSHGVVDMKKLLVGIFLGIACATAHDRSPVGQQNSYWTDTAVRLIQPSHTSIGFGATVLVRGDCHAGSSMRGDM